MPAGHRSLPAIPPPLSRRGRDRPDPENLTISVARQGEALRRFLREALRGVSIIQRQRRVSEEAFRRARAARAPGFAVAARIRDLRGRTLLVRPRQQSSDGTWWTPGGRGEPGEDPPAALEREVWEETGGRLRDPVLWKAHQEVLLSPSGHAYRWWFFQYRARWSGGVARPVRTREIAEVRWFSRLPPDLAFRSDWLLRPGRSGGSQLTGSGVFSPHKDA